MESIKKKKVDSIHFEKCEAGTKLDGSVADLPSLRRG